MAWDVEEARLAAELRKENEMREGLLPHWIASAGLSIILLGLTLAIILVRVWYK